jgi:hypothetical protein
VVFTGPAFHDSAGGAADHLAAREQLQLEISAEKAGKGRRAVLTLFGALWPVSENQSTLSRSGAIAAERGRADRRRGPARG